MNVMFLGSVFPQAEPEEKSILFQLEKGLRRLSGLSYTIGAAGYAVKRPRLFPGFFGFHE